MLDFLGSESSSLGSKSGDPVIAAIEGKLDDGGRSPLEFSAESSDMSETILPMSGPDPLELDKPIGEDEFVRQARRKGIDPLTGSDEPAIQTRSGFDRAGNNRRRAYNIGTLDDNAKFYSDSVSRRDRKDFYKFTLEEKGEVDINLSGLRGNADLFLHNSRGKMIEKSRKGGRRSEAISETLEAGDYYVQVRSRNRRVSTNYNLELDFESITPPIEEETTGSEWRGSFYRFDGNEPSVHFHENEANKLAVLNLGSSSGKEFRGNWGSGSPNSEYIPNDNFAVRSYTHAYFENGKQYEFNVSADDGYQIFAKQHGTNDWFDVTTKNQWSTDAYGGKTISHTWEGPTDNYDLHFQYYEIGGDAYFNLDWKEVDGGGGAQRILNAIDRVNPEQWYYEKRDITGDGIKETFCNWFAADVLEVLGVPIPRHSQGMYPPVFGEQYREKPFSADYLYNHFKRGGYGGEWQEVNQIDAADRANNGQVVVASSPAPASGISGHIAIVRPGSSESDIRIAQAGWDNGKDLNVSEGFGDSIHSTSFFVYVG